MQADTQLPRLCVCIVPSSPLLLMCAHAQPKLGEQVGPPYLGHRTADRADSSTLVYLANASRDSASPASASASAEPVSCFVIRWGHGVARVARVVARGGGHPRRGCWPG